jgi:putative nucleotidyltransferase with HDIG domain
MLIGKWLNLGEDNIKDIIIAGLLHDIGKTKVPADILNKKTRLTDEEFEIIKNHTIYGYEIVKSADCFSEEVCNAVVSHHEREDKSGYPFGIGSRKTNIYSKIIAVADVYDAMTSDRVYKKRVTPFEVFEMFQTIGVKNFNHKIIQTFLTNLAACYVGSKVLLNTGEVGEVVYIPLHSITEPVIYVGSDYLDLAKSGSKQILCML